MSQGISTPEQAIRIDYIEFPATDLNEIKRFYTAAFGWTFTDYGSTYTSFNCGNLTGGFWTTPTIPRSSPLVVLYTKNLETIQQGIIEAGGKIAARL